MHKHFKDVEFEPNVLAADAIGFAETRLCRRDENVHFTLKRFKLIRLDVVLYKYPKSSQTEFKNDLHRHLRPEIDPDAKLVILGDFNVQIDSGNTDFVNFMETLFRTMQQIKRCTTDYGSILDLIFTNCEAFCDAVEACLTDHKLVYCAIDR